MLTSIVINTIAFMDMLAKIPDKQQMKLCTFFCICFFNLVAYENTSDTIFTVKDTNQVTTPNSLLFQYPNYETLNNSYVLGGGVSFIRSQENPLITIDGLPTNPIIFKYLPFNEYLFPPSILSFDLEETAINTNIYESKIISGYHNNSINLKTSEIHYGISKAKINANNYSSINFIDLDKVGCSIINNLNIYKPFNKVTFRLSLSNGCMNSFIPNEGLKRYGGNIKLKLKLLPKTNLIGYFDFTNFNDFRRTGKNSFKSDRIFSYLKFNSELTNWLEIIGISGISSLKEDFNREIISTYLNPFMPDDVNNASYNLNNNYHSKSYQSDLSLRFKYNFENFLYFSVVAGINANSSKYPCHIISDFRSPTSQRFASGNFNLETTEQKKYFSTNLVNEYFSLDYSFDITKHRFLADTSDGLFNHHVGINVPILNKRNGPANEIGISGSFSRLINLSLKSFDLYFSSLYLEQPFGALQTPTLAFEFSIFGAFFNQKLTTQLNWYSKIDDRLLYVPALPSYLPDSTTHTLEETIISLGRNNRFGGEINGSLKLVETNDKNWSLLFSYSNNTVDFKKKNSYLKDTAIRNSIYWIQNSIKIKNFSIYFSMEGKSGFDYNYFNRKISTAGTSPYYDLPWSNERREIITGISNNGEPIREAIGYQDRNALIKTNYFILKNFGFEYSFKQRPGWLDELSIGIMFNRIRRIYIYLNDIERYQNQQQLPSFMNSIDLSLDMKF